MEPDFWQQRWKNNQIGFHQPDINPYLRRFWPAVGVAPGAAVFVPLAGKSRDMLWLRERGHPVLGVEISSLAVEAFYAENGIEATRSRQDAFEVWQGGGITLYCGDVFELTLSHLSGIGGVYERASLVALPAELRRRYVAHMLEILPPRAPTLLVTFEYPQQEMQGPPFSVSESEVRELYDMKRMIDKLFDEDVLHQEPKLREAGLSWVREKVYALRKWP